MNHESNSDLGLNRTGTKISSQDSIKTIESARALSRPSPGDCSAIAENRILYIKEADAIGAVPMPTSLKGVKASLEEKIVLGNHAMIDKLGERLAFERSGTRLYEALIIKYNSSEHKKRLPDLPRMKQFYHEELKHFQLISEVIKNIGADPTSLTPAADISAIASAGWSQVLTDPRTSFLQSLEIILQAELVDNVGWEILIELAERNGLGDLAIQFQQSLDEEAFHLITVKQWVQELTLNDEIISPEQNFVEFDIDSIIKH